MQNRPFQARRALAALALLAVAGGCMRSTSHVGVMTPAHGTAGFKLLQPNVSRRACASSWFGFGPGQVGVDTVLAQLLTLDDEAQLVTDADVRWDTIVTGVYNRRCVEVRGDLARPAAIVRMPSAPGGHAHH